MKTIASIALSVCTAALIAACGGTKNTAAASSPTPQEFDPATAAWQPLTKVVTPPPPQGGAVIVEQKKPGMMKKVGDTLKKPLQWVGLGKDEPQPVSAATAPAAATKKPPAQP